MKALSYLLALIIPLSVYISLTFGGVFSYTALVVAFVFVPIFDQLLPSVEDLEPELKKDTVMDSILYLVGFFHLYLLYIFVTGFSVGEPLWVIIGKTLSMGISCGSIGINVAHELGHRKEKYHIASAFVLLATSLYTQFYIEHNKGHHRHVATLKDPATARLNETVYSFIFRSAYGTFMGAYKLDRKMFYIGQGLQLGLVLLIYFTGGLYAALGFVGAALFGAFDLEVVNYIEHYGLLRKTNPSGRPEKVRPHHSWNSNHYLGRKILFELTRHSDHHTYASKPFYDLRSYEEAPNLPAGYPAMMLLSLVPPLFFKIMNPKVKSLA